MTNDHKHIAALLALASVYLLLVALHSSTVHVTIVNHVHVPEMVYSTKQHNCTPTTAPRIIDAQVDAFESSVRVLEREILQIYNDRQNMSCSEFLSHHNMIPPLSASPYELQRPLAFSISMHANVSQTIRLLRMLYWPHNIYCIHVDAKAPTPVHDTMQYVAGRTLNSD